MTGFPAPRRIRTNGVELSVHLAGPQDGLPLLLLHGWPELAHSWKPVFPALAQAGFRLIAPDLRGFGASDAPKDAAGYAIDAVLADLTGLLDALEIEKAVWAGHDWGGIIAWHGAMLVPERVSGVIGVNTPHLPRGAQPPVAALTAIYGEDHYINRFQQPGLAEAAFEGREDAFFAFIFETAPPQRVFERRGGEVTHLVKNFAAFEGRAEKRIAVPPEERKVYAAAYRRTGFAPGFGLYRNLDANWERMAGVDHRLAMPCLMVLAERDFMLPPALARWMPALCADLETHTLDACGHWTMWERPAELSALVTDWLARRF